MCGGTTCAGDLFEVLDSERVRMRRAPPLHTGNEGETDAEQIQRPGRIGSFPPLWPEQVTCQRRCATQLQHHQVRCDHDVLSREAQDRGRVLPSTQTMVAGVFALRRGVAAASGTVITLAGALLLGKALMVRVPLYC